MSRVEPKVELLSYTPEPGKTVAMAAKPDFMISHSPGYMFICDVQAKDLDAKL